MGAFTNTFGKVIKGSGLNQIYADYSLNLNGIDDYVSATTLGNYGSTYLKEGTVEIIFKTSQQTKFNLLGTVNDGPNTILSVFMNTNDGGATSSAGHMYFSIRDNTGHYYSLQFKTTNPVNFYDNVRHRISVVWSIINKSVLFYLDGVIVPTTKVLDNITNNFANFQYPLVIGGHNVRGTISNYFNGKIYDFRLWIDMRIQSEIIQTLWSDLNGDETGLYTYYKFKDAIDSSIEDSSLNNYTGTIYGAVIDNEVSTRLSLTKLDEKYSGNWFTIPNSGGLKYGGITHPSLLYFPTKEDGYKYWMYYECLNDGSDNSSNTIWLVRSNDGITWTDTGITNPIIDIPEGTHDPDIIKLGNTWYMFVLSGNPSGKELYRLSSSDGKSFSNKITVLTNGIIGSWDDDAVLSPTIYIENGTWYMYYAGRKNDSTGKTRIGLATSSDGTTWTKYGSNPILEPISNSWENWRLWHLKVGKYGDKLYVFYSAYLSNIYTVGLDYLSCIGVATSTNLTSFTRFEENPILVPDEIYELGSQKHYYVACPLRDINQSIVVINNKLNLYYSGVSNLSKLEIGLAYIK